MKIASFIFAILGALFAFALGAVWLSDASDARELIKAAEGMGMDTSELDSIVRAAYMLLLSGVAAIFAGAMTLKGKGKLGGIILAVAVVGPAVFAAKTLLATFFLALAALFAFLAKPKR